MKQLFLLMTAAITFAACQSETTKMPLKFNSDGKFKIAQFTDMHLVDGSPNSAKTSAAIKHVLETEKPNVAILTGDQAIDRPSKNVWPEIARIFEEAQTPFAVVLGNHDAETITKDSIFDILSRSPYFIGEKGPDNIYGVGNYVLEVRSQTSDKTAALLYCFDSNDYTRNNRIGYYDWIRYDQIAWYRQQSQRYTQANNNQPLPALAFFHIPLREYANIAGKETTIGTKGENIAPAEINSGMFASFVEMQDVMGVFVGHDHNNDYIGTTFDIALAYGRVTGADAYGKLERGARIIELEEDKPENFTTWIRAQSGVEHKYYYPSGLSEEQEAKAVYLPAQSFQPSANGVAYSYYEGKLQSVEEIASLQPLKTGTLDNFSIADAAVEDGFAYEFCAWIKIPEKGVYRFYTLSDDGTKLYIDGQTVVDNDGSHSKQYVYGEIALEAGFHQLRLLYFEDYDGQMLEVGFLSKNIFERPIPNELLYLPNVELNVMTFNIRYDNPDDSLNNWQYRKDAAAEMIKEYAPDLLGAQEALVNQLNDLKERLPLYAAMGVGRADGKEAGEYAPVLYRKERFEEDKSGHFWLSETPEVAGSKGWDGACERIATWAILKDKATQQRLFFLNTHLDHVGQTARREGVKLLLEQAERLSEGLPVIIVGDFNAPPESEVVQQVLADGKFFDTRLLAPSLPEISGTFHGFGKVPVERRKIIDYVFVTGDLAVNTYTVVPEKRGEVFLSDHTPVFVKIAIK